MKKRDKRKLAIAILFLVTTLACVIDMIARGMDTTLLLAAVIMGLVSLLFFRNSAD